MLCKFQALGHLLYWVDALTEARVNQSIGAIFEFDANVAALGFEPYDPVRILTAPNWKMRMVGCLVCHGLRRRNRSKAAGLPRRPQLLAKHRLLQSRLG